jgi:hypothetical protein
MARIGHLRGPDVFHQVAQCEVVVVEVVAPGRAERLGDRRPAGARVSF